MNPDNKRLMGLDADMMACHKKSTYYGTNRKQLPQIDIDYKPNACNVTFFKKIEL